MRRIYCFEHKGYTTERRLGPPGITVGFVGQRSRVTDAAPQDVGTERELEFRKTAVPVAGALICLDKSKPSAHISHASFEIFLEHMLLFHKRKTVPHQRTFFFPLKF